MEIEPCVMRAPSMRSFMRLMQRNKVVLPQPDGPMKAVTARRRYFKTDIEQDLMAAVVKVDVLNVDRDLALFRFRGWCFHLA